MTTKMYFATAAAAAMFEMEFSGQISDGKYENSRPHDHWEWLRDYNIVIDSNHARGYVGPWHTISYNFPEWIEVNGPKAHLKRYAGYQWATRTMAYARAGKAFGERALHQAGYLHAVVEFIFDHMDTRFASVEDLKNNIDSRSYLHEYISKCELTDEMLRAYYDTEYTYEELKQDYEYCWDAMNRSLGCDEI